jgi:hypothetical protein
MTDFHRSEIGRLGGSDSCFFMGRIFLSFVDMVEVSRDKLRSLASNHKSGFGVTYHLFYRNDQLRSGRVRSSVVVESV